MITITLFQALFIHDSTVLFRLHDPDYIFDVQMHIVTELVVQGKSVKLCWKYYNKPMLEEIYERELHVSRDSDNVVLKEGPRFVSLLNPDRSTRELDSLRFIWCLARFLRVQNE